jgi:hypothetical protein
MGDVAINLIEQLEPVSLYSVEALEVPGSAKSALPIYFQTGSNVVSGH